MSLLSREECIELGVSVPTTSLIGWASEQLAAGKARSERLERRGIHGAFLQTLKGTIDKVAEIQGTLGKDRSALPTELLQAQRVREDAFAYWQEVQQIVKVEFATRPEIQAKFQMGIRTGHLISNLRRVLEGNLALLRAHSAELSWLGVNEAFLKSGEVLIGKLHEAQTTLEAGCRGLPALLMELSFEKGKLYDLTRKLVRIGRLEFLQEPEQSAVFNYELLRKELRAGSQMRIKMAKETVR